MGLQLKLAERTFFFPENENSFDYINAFEFYGAIIKIINNIKLKDLQKISSKFTENSVSITTQIIKELKLKKFNNKKINLKLSEEKRKLSNLEKQFMFEEIFNLVYNILSLDMTKNFSFCKHALFYFFENYKNDEFKDCILENKEDFSKILLIDQKRYQLLLDSLFYNDFHFKFTFEQSYSFKFLNKLDFEKEYNSKKNVEKLISDLIQNIKEIKQN